MEGAAYGGAYGEKGGYAIEGSGSGFEAFVHGVDGGRFMGDTRNAFEQ